MKANFHLYGFRNCNGVMRKKKSILIPFIVLFSWLLFQVKKSEYPEILDLRISRLFVASGGFIFAHVMLGVVLLNVHAVGLNFINYYFCTQANKRPGKYACDS